MSESREERPPHDPSDPRGGGGTGGAPGTEGQAEWAEKETERKNRAAETSPEEETGGEGDDAGADAPTRPEGDEGWTSLK